MDTTFDRWGEASCTSASSSAASRSALDAAGVLAAAAMASAFMVSYTRAKRESLGFAPGTGMAVGFAPREVRLVILSIGLVVAGLLPALGRDDLAVRRRLPLQRARAGSRSA